MTAGIDMGKGVGGERSMLDLEELLATRLLVQGNSGSGKSHLLRRLLEQSAGWVQQVIIDPEGDFVTLAERYGHVAIEGERTEAELVGIAARVRQHRVSCVLSLEGLDAEEQMRAAAIFLNGLFDADRDFWYPVLVVVDEAQLFAPAASGEVADEVRRLSLGAMTNLMCRGRKRGLAGVIATQRLAKLAKNVAAEASNFLMGRTFLDIDMARAADLLGLDRRQAEMFRDLPRGSFVALGPALTKRPVKVEIGAVETSARSSSPKLMPLPEATVDAADLILTPDPSELARPITRYVQPAPRPATDIMAELSKPRGEEIDMPEARPKRAELTPEEREELIAGALADVLAGNDSTFRSDAELYQDFLVRCRIRRLSGAALALPDFRHRLAVIRSGADEEMQASELWLKALTLSHAVTDDLKAVFLMLANAALRGMPCPSDAALARSYGTHSVRRARRLLGYFEEQGLVVLHQDRAGNRIVAFPDLGVETAPGNPDAPEAEARLAAE
jgi:DNA helicase HerA-like ATPase